MKPEESSSRQSGMPLLPQGPNDDISNQSQTQEAAANVIRAQINTILIPKEKSAKIEDSNPYKKTHDNSPETDAEKWKTYHSAWQNYYQKYYEGYYTHHLRNAQQRLMDQKTQSDSGEKSQEEALSDLHQELLGKVKESANKVKKSKHFIPLISGVIVVLLFLLLQYNRVIISNVVAYVSPGNIDPQNIIVDPNASVVVGPESRLIIPKINVDVPVLYDIGNDYKSQMAAMTNGVAHFSIPGANSHPGEIGNTVIAGHSSNDLLDYGKYKFIFAQLDKLNVGDTIYANYNSVRYTYTVTKKEVVKPNEVDKLVYESKQPVLTLVTCTPLGTAISRLLISATQISPDPSKSTAAPTLAETETQSIPGNSPTIFERIFGSSGN